MACSRVAVTWNVLGPSLVLSELTVVRMLCLYHERQLSLLNAGPGSIPGQLLGLSLSGFAPSASIFACQRHSPVLYTYISFSSHRHNIIVLKLPALLNNTHT